MSTRRKFLASSTLAVSMPLLSVALSACDSDAAQSDTVNDEDLRRQMVAKLAAELDDSAAAAVIEPYLFDIGLTWSPPTVPAAQIDRIVAYAFGNRPNAASGTTSSSGVNQAALPDPGPVNEMLADAVYRIHQLKAVKVYAQWEVARFLASKYQMKEVVSIEPITASDGSITYLSTDGVALDIVGREASAAAMGCVAVVGHRDHAKRCVQTSRAHGMDAYVVGEVALPVEYDAQSGQPWTRRRDLYLVHDMYAQFGNLRTALIAEHFPNG